MKIIFFGQILWEFRISTFISLCYKASNMFFEFAGLQSLNAFLYIQSFLQDWRFSQEPSQLNPGNSSWKIENIQTPGTHLIYITWSSLSQTYSPSNSTIKVIKSNPHLVYFFQFPSTPKIIRHFEKEENKSSWNERTKKPQKRRERNEIIAGKEK